MKLSFVSHTGSIAYNQSYLEQNLIKDKLRELIPSEVLDFLSDYVDITSKSTKILETSSRFNIINLEEENVQNIVNIKKINDIRYLNKFLESVNEKLPFDGLLIGNVETIDERRKRILGNRHTPFKYFYYSMDYSPGSVCF